MATLDGLRSIYNEVEQVRKPNREVSPFMNAYLDRKGAIADALRETLDIPEGLILDEMPEETEIPPAVQAQIGELQEWLDQQDFRNIPAEVRAQLEKLEASFREL